MPACGETVKQNLTYLIQAETQAPNTMFCSYTICPVSSDVNRIRLDFTVSCFEIEAKLSFSTWIVLHIVQWGATKTPQKTFSETKKLQIVLDPEI